MPEPERRTQRFELRMRPSVNALLDVEAAEGISTSAITDPGTGRVRAGYMDLKEIDLPGEGDGTPLTTLTFQAKDPKGRLVWIVVPSASIVAAKYVGPRVDPKLVRREVSAVREWPGTSWPKNAS